MAHLNKELGEEDAALVTHGLNVAKLTVRT